MQKEGSYATLLKPRIFRGLLSLAVKGYFVQKGWLNAYLTKQAISASGDPIPWLTYSFLDFLEPRLTKELSLFEYGSGNSTLFFAKQIQFVRSIEHDEKWYKKIKAELPSNVEISYIPVENQQYETVILANDRLYDIVLIDGRERLACLKHAIQRLSPQGIIILDDAERPKYKDAFPFMKNLGFKHIPFSGIAIGAIHDKQTVVFYKAENCLGI